MSDKVPVTVLTGYLGAGKTTLFNRILSEPHGQKYAVIVNEFGEIGIDNELVVGADEEVFEMNNGCICCTVRGDLVRIIDGLMRRKGKFDAIIVETTGLGRPGAGRADLLRRRERRTEDQARRSGDRRRRQVAERPAQGRARGEEPDRLRRRDPAQQDRPRAARTNWTRSKAASAGSIPTPGCTAPQRSNIPIKEVLGRNAFDLDRILDIEPDFLETGEHHHHGHDHHHDHGQEHEHHDHDHHDHDHDDHHHHEHHAHAHGGVKHYHDEEMHSLSLSTDKPLDPDKFFPWIQDLTQKEGPSILRCKGILSFKDDDERFVLQGVHMILDGDHQRPWKDGEKRTSRLVFIGRKLPEEMIRKGFEGCVA